jgi:hypothetical protein
MPRHGLIPLGYTQVGFERITVAGTASSLTVPTNGVGALVQIETEGTVRYLTTSTAPTSTSGTLAFPGEDIFLSTPAELSDFKVIRVGSTSVSVSVTYYKRGLP